MLEFYVVFGAFGIAMLFVIYGTIAKNDWGINLSTVSCPRCGTPLAYVHAPQNVRQSLWGGYTCLSCGAEVDKWGREIRRRIATGAQANGTRKS